MPTESRWYIPQRVVHIRLYGEISLEDIRTTVCETNALYEQGIAPVYALFDASEIKRIPKSIDEYRDVFNVEMHPNLAYIVAFGIRNPFVSFLTSIFAQTVRRDFRITRTLDDALKLIEKLEGKPLPAPPPTPAPTPPPMPAPEPSKESG